MTALEVVDGTFRYPLSRRPLLEGVNFRVGAGELLAVLGPNGAGKTTLMRTMTGLQQWTSGRTIINGTDLKDMSPRDIGRTIAYVPQARSAASLSLSGLDMVTLGRAAHLGMFTQPGPAEEVLAAETLNSIGAGQLAHMPCGTMSGGQFQMILIARALVAQPEILVLDEPETGLDFHNQMVVLKLLHHLVKEQNLVVVMNTHYPAHAIRVADRAILIDAAHRVTFGPVAEVMTEEKLGEIFDVELRISDIDHGDVRVPTITALDVRRHWQRG